MEWQYLVIVGTFILFVFTLGVFVGTRFFDVHSRNVGSLDATVATVRESESYLRKRMKQTTTEMESMLEAMKHDEEEMRQRIQREAKQAPQMPSKTAAAHLHQAPAASSNKGVLKNGMAPFVWCMRNPNSDGCAPLPSAQFMNNQYLEPKAISHNYADVTVSAFIFLSKSDDNVGMKTIVANRAGGCPPHPKRNGYALYVNEWETKDKNLILMWGDTKDGCNRIETGPNRVPLDRWVHVGFTMLTRGSTLTVKLFMDGELVASKSSPARLINKELKWRIGMHNDDDHRFSGRIGPVLVSDFASDDLVQWKAVDGPPKLTYSASGRRIYARAGNVHI